MFISKISLIFIIYFGFAAIIITYIIKNKEKSREEYIHSRLEISLPFYIVLSILIKVLFSVFGSVFKKLANLAFIIDFYLTYMCILGLYFGLNQTKTYYTDVS